MLQGVGYYPFQSRIRGHPHTPAAVGVLLRGKGRRRERAWGRLKELPCFGLHMCTPDASWLCLCARADRFHWSIWMALGLTLLCVPIIIWTVENLVRVSEREGGGEGRGLG